MTSIIEFSEVTVCYNDIPALDGVNVDIGGGAIGLLGPNGAGKSTLIKTILGFNRANKGRVKIFGLEMPARSVEIRHRLGYMPECEVSSPKVSAVAFLSYCGRIFGISRVDALERAHEVLNYVNLGDSRYRNMETYSTGMLQRVKLAQAILHDPKLLLLDEPTNGLDPDGRLEILDLVRDIAARPDVTVVVSSHLLPDVQHVCEQVIMIDKGKVVHAGSIEELTAPRLEYCEVRLRDSAQPFVDAVREAGCECVRLHPLNTWLVRLPHENGAQLLFRIARDCGTQIRHFQPSRHSLEEAFLQVMEKE
ncbi:MAG: ABC transporter ATP-binding protein [Candidatus Hydrogenedentes bacterium]|nr:ABC transporter ATP-binding protein [Candidatus Hydrogenedentota bacterium]